MKNLDSEIVEQLFYNILPRGDTILHIVHRNGELLEELLQRAHDNPDDRRKIKIHIPLLPNIVG